MIILKILGLAILILAGIGLIGLILKAFSKAVNSPDFDRIFNPPVTPYNYKPTELWEAPAHWKNWETNK